ncbi:MAG: pilus assembly protein [Chloroflexi bacterium]|nr:pilus assembly protein [Chloroflexota bacterium]
MIRRHSLRSHFSFGRRWRLCRRAQRGQSLVEMAVFLPLIAFFGLACVQFAVVFIAYINVINTTRDAARWIAVHPHVIDSTNLATVQGRLPAALNAAALTMTVSPTCTALTSGKCSGRTGGTQLSVTSSYNIASHMFLPTSFGFGSMVIRMPTSLPNYTIVMQVEPT